MLTKQALVDSGIDPVPPAAAFHGVVAHPTSLKLAANSLIFFIDILIHVMQKRFEGLNYQ